MANKIHNTTTVETKYKNVVVYIHNTEFNFKIVETLSTGKIKVRRRVQGRPSKTEKGFKRVDHYGEQLVEPFKSFDDAKTNALNYVDNFLVLTQSGESL